MVLARWETNGGSYWVELSTGRLGFYFRTHNDGGRFGPVLTYKGETEKAAAMRLMQKAIDSGYYLPDTAILPMVRVV